MAESENVTSQGKTDDKGHKIYTVLGQKVGGGPHGLGDPNDKTLRKVEKDVLIMEKVRNKSRIEKCNDLSQAFGKCAKEAGLLMAFKCREENEKLKECLKYWFQNEEFVAQCQQEYIDERSQYRRTGIPVKKYNRATRSFVPNTESDTS